MVLTNSKFCISKPYFQLLDLEIRKSPDGLRKPGLPSFFSVPFIGGTWSSKPIRPRASCRRKLGLSGFSVKIEVELHVKNWLLPLVLSSVNSSLFHLLWSWGQKELLILKAVSLLEGLKDSFMYLVYGSFSCSIKPLPPPLHIYQCGQIHQYSCLWRLATAWENGFSELCLLLSVCLSVCLTAAWSARGPHSLQAGVLQGGEGRKCRYWRSSRIMKCLIVLSPLPNVNYIFFFFKFSNWWNGSM